MTLLALVAAQACRRYEPVEDAPSARSADRPASERFSVPDALRPTEAVSPNGSGAGFLGVVLPRRSVEVTTQQTGRLVAVEVEVGDSLRQGDAIARVDPRAVTDDLEMGRANLKARRADVEQRSAELDEAEKREARRMRAPELFSREDLDTAKRELKAAQAALEAAQAQVAGAKSQVEQLETQVAETVIRAPFDGEVSRRYVDAGATVAPGDPIVRFIAKGDLLVRFAVPPSDVKALAPGSAVAIHVSGEHPLEAAVERIAPEIDSASGMIFVEARLPQSSADLGPIPSAGAVARVVPSGAERPPSPPQR